MNLLQIHEPGETPDPHAGETRAAIGIDLGTTHSVVSVIEEGEMRVLTDAAGNRLHPSVVTYLGEYILAGHAAVVKEGQGYTVRSVKRHMHTASQALDAEGKRTPVEISAEILRYIKTVAELNLDYEVTDAVITVPAYFDDTARTATRDAARLAGLNVLRLVNEPTAAALAYGLDKGVEGLYAIYDLGGGTFDISLLKLEKEVFQVLSTGGNTQLGGDDIDRAIVAELIGEEALETLPHTVLQPMLLTAREAKERLSKEECVSLMLAEKEYSLTCSQLEALAMPLVTQTLDACANVLEDADIQASAVNGVVLVGGSTRMPLIAQQVEAFFGKAPLRDIDPDEVVAAGAALQAHALTHGANTLLLDVIPLSLGLETMGALTEKIIHRNTPIPVSVTQEFTTYQDGQAAMKIHVVQGEREMVGDNRSLAEFTLNDIPPLPAGIARIAVNFTVDADGLLSVSAKEMTTGIAQHIDVKPSYGLDEHTMAAMLRESMQHAREDITERLLVEARVEAERVIIEIESAVKQSPGAITESERKLIERQIRILRNVMQQDDRDYIDVEMQQLSRLVGPFAERRMNDAIASTLKGSHIERIDKHTTNKED